MRLKNIIWKTVVMSLMASPLCISCDDDDEVTVNSKFYLSTKVFPVDSYEASLSVILKDNSVVVNELQPNYRFVACATERLSKDVKITADSDDNLVSAYNKANDTEYNRFFVKFGGTSSIVNKESWLSVVYFLPYCTSAFLAL